MKKYEDEDVVEAIRDNPPYDGQPVDEWLDEIEDLMDNLFPHMDKEQQLVRCIGIAWHGRLA